MEAYAIVSPQSIDGTMKERVCTGLGGIIVVQSLDSTVSQSIRVCELGEKKYELFAEDNPIVGPIGCIAIEASGRDPETGERHQFGNPCNVPRGCDATSDWGGNLPSYYVHQQDVQINGTEYSFFVGVYDFWCTQKIFNIDTKKFAFDAIGRKTGEDTVRMDIAFPQEVLGGNLTLLVDGNSTKFDSAKRDGYTIISTSLPAYDQYERTHIELIGTEVIPEFGSGILAVVSVSIGAILIWTRFDWKSNLD